MRNSAILASAVAFAAILAFANAAAVPSPTASFMANPTEGEAPLTVFFTDESIGTITNWTWDFGDSATSNVTFSLNPAHVYDIPGIYTVQLTVSGPGGANTETRQDLITVIPEPSTILLVGLGIALFGVQLTNPWRKQ